MNLIVIDLTYKVSLDQVEQYLEAHRAFLDKNYDNGVFLLSGPKEPREGGVILVKASNI